MSGRDPIWDDLKQNRKEKFDSDRRAFMAQAANEDDGLWTKHTQWHWSRMVEGLQLDYWPSRKKFRYMGKTMRGDVYKYLNRIES